MVKNKTMLKTTLLEHARTAFQTRGFEKTTTRTIAASLGIANGTLFNHYKNKDALLVAVILDACFKDVPPTSHAPKIAAIKLTDHLLETFNDYSTLLPHFFAALCKSPEQLTTFRRLMSAELFDGFEDYDADKREFILDCIWHSLSHCLLEEKPTAISQRLRRHLQWV